MSVTVDVSERVIYNVGREFRRPIDRFNDRYVLDRIEQRYNVVINSTFIRANDGRHVAFNYSIEFKFEKDATFFLLRFS
jgi:ribosomal protein S4E